MKQIISKFLIILAAVLLVTSCEWEPIKFDSSKTFVAFEAQSSAFAEEVEGQVGVVVMVTALLDAPAVTANFEFDTTGLGDKAAVEGEDFTLMNDSKTLSFPDGWGYDTIWIDPGDNDIFTGDRLFNIVLTTNSLDYDFGAFVSHTVTLKDNEHPLGKWIGTYDVDAQSYGDPENWDEAWTVTTRPDPEDVTVLLLNGIGGPDYSEFTDVPATVDKEAMTITIEAGAEIGTHGLYGGPLAIYFGDEAGGIDNETDPMVGTIEEDGSIHIDHMAIKFVGGINEGLVWDSFDTYWSPASKKAAKRNKTAGTRPGVIEQ